MFDFITIDFETANEKRNSACSIGIAAVKGLKVVETYHSLIRPEPCEFRDINTHIHGITAEMVENEKTLAELLPEISHYFTPNIPVVAHNAEFDISVFKESCTAKLPGFFYADSMDIVKPYISGSRKLEKCAAELGVCVECHHDAADDARVCAEICIEALQRAGCCGVWECIAKQGLSFKSVNVALQKKETKSKNETAPKKHSYSKVKPFDISQTVDAVDEGNPLFGKVIVFTGDMSIKRKDAMQLAVNCGAVVKSGVTRATDYLVVGVQDKDIVGEDGMSGKEEKAHQLNADGVANIVFLSEEQFVAMTRSESLV